MRTTGRWVRRGPSVVVLGLEREDAAASAGPTVLEVPSVVSTTSRPTLRRGAEGSAVRDLQMRLAAHGVGPGAADGIFGSLTEAAVKSFQRARGLVADGIAGPQTWAALGTGTQAPGGPPQAPLPPRAPVGGLDPAIETLKLSEPARGAAYLIKRKHPWVVFTSGRRDPVRQAWAMAGNVVKNRRWIQETYAKNPVSVAAQAWVDAHPEARTQQAIADGLISVFSRFSPLELGRLSRHLSGLAFDIRPVPAQQSVITTTIRSLPGLREFLTREGGLTIWHVAF